MMRSSAINSKFLSVIVPAFNEAANVDSILRRLRSVLPDAEIIFVDDGSTDETGDIASEVGSELDIRVLALERNSGKGAAVQLGLESVTGKWVVIQDADLEYNPQDILLLAEQAEQANHVAIYGSRYLSRGHAAGGAWLNYIGVKLLAVLQWLLYGQWLSDPHTCYKMVRSEILKGMAIRSRGFELCAEINSKLLAVGHTIKEVPIRYSPRTAAAGKKIRLRDFFIAVWTYVRYRFVISFPAEPVSNLDDRPSVSSKSYAVSRLAIGCLLLIAASMKLSPANAMPVAPWLVLSASAVFCWAIIEFALGWICLTMVPHRLVNRVLIGLFSVFLLVLAIKWISGETRCECLGSVAMPLGIMAIVDLVILASLIYFCTDWECNFKSPAGFISSQALNLRILLPVLLLACITWFGSVDATRSFLAGDTILVDSFSKYAGNVGENEFVDVSYTLRNPTSEPVRVLGAKASCSCIAILDLPTTVEPGSTKAIRLRVKGQQAETVQRESAELFFDDSALHIVLNATAVVRPNH